MGYENNMDYRWWKRVFSWDFHVYNENNPLKPVFFSKTLFRVKGWTVRIHKFVAADAPGCFHSHPAHAWRLVIWGGYDEEIPCSYYDDPPCIEKWRPGRFGWIHPEFEHRIDKLHNERSSYSLWVRGPIIANVKTTGCD